MVKQYGVCGLKKFVGRDLMGILHATFIIDKKVKAVYVVGTVKAKIHDQDLLRWIIENL